MTTALSKLLLLPFFSFLLTIVSLPLVKRLATKYGVVAEPYSETRPETVPLLGGLSIIGAILIALHCAGALPVTMELGVLALLLVGLVDDVIVLRPRTKFVMQVAVVVFVVVAGPRFDLSPWRLVDAGIEIFWLLSTVNAFNLIDGLDGLAGGVGMAAGVAVAAIGFLHHDRVLTCQGLAIGGALAGFLVMNLYPASVFMGDCGALPLGLLLGAVALNAGEVARETSRLGLYAVPVLLMLMPLLDTAIVCVSRLATGSAVSRRGHDHSHHRLLLLGLSEPVATAICWLVAVSAALCAVAITLMPHAYVIVTLPFIVLPLSVIGLFMIDLTFDAQPPGEAYGYLQGISRLILNACYKRRLAEAALDFVLVVAAYFGAFLIRLNFIIGDGRAEAMVRAVPFVLMASYASFLVIGIYRGIWRYAGMSDVIRLANASVLAGVLVVLGSLFVPMEISGSIVVLFVILLFNLLVATRLSFRALRRAFAVLARRTERVLIIGAGEMGEAATRYVFSGSSGNMLRLVGFVDDDAFKRGKLVHGYRVLGSLDDLEEIYRGLGFNQILIAAETLAADRLARVREIARKHGIALCRFSIRVNEIAVTADLAAEESPVTRSPSPAAARGVVA